MNQTATHPTTSEFNKVEATCPRCHGLLETNIRVSDAAMQVILQCRQCEQLYELSPFTGPAQ